MLGVPGTKPDYQRVNLPMFNNITFSQVEARSRRSLQSFNVGSPSADYWNTTQSRTHRPVFVSDPRSADEFVVYSPGSPDWVPSRQKSTARV